MKEISKTWHQQHQSKLTAGQRIADKVAEVMGSWPAFFYSSGLCSSYYYDVSK